MKVRKHAKLITSLLLAIGLGVAYLFSPGSYSPQEADPSILIDGSGTIYPITQKAVDE